jgi:hypothetical protein
LTRKEDYTGAVTQLAGLAINNAEIDILVSVGNVDNYYNVTGTKIKIVNVKGIDI